MFEAALQSSTLPRQGLWRGTVLSTAAHGAALALALAASRQAPQKKIEPASVTFKEWAAPAPLKGGGGNVAQTEAPRKRAVVRKDSYVPVRDRPAAAPQATTADDPGKGSGPPGGEKDGSDLGTPWGTGTGTAVASAPPPPSAPPPQNTVLSFGEGMQRPSRIGGPDPVYPSEARTAKVEGTLLVRCVITRAGTLERCQILKSLPFLDQPVLEALSRQRYTPVMFDGRPVDVWYTIPFHFKLQ